MRRHGSGEKKDAEKEKLAARTRRVGGGGTAIDALNQNRSKCVLFSLSLPVPWFPFASRNCYSFFSLDPEPARFLTRMKSESINKKEAAELECSATGDSPIEISWSKEDKVIKEAKERFL